jgi:crossover junction endodeoxyribonuclease RuvC
MFDMRVLGVDPGVARLGLAVVARRGRDHRVLWTDVVRTPPGMDEAQRLMLLVAAVRQTMNIHVPTALAVERVAFNRNAVSAMAVARVTGALMVAGAEAGLPVEEYSPTEVKNAITGVGNAGKDQVRAALVRVHGLAHVPLEPDASDAVAVALTHLSGMRLRAAARAVAR